MQIHYKPKGVCSREINIKIEDGIIRETEIIGGCSGNSQGICALVKGMAVGDAITRLTGICCGYKKTSCPDQLSKALAQAIE